MFTTKIRKALAAALLITSTLPIAAVAEARTEFLFERQAPSLAVAMDYGRNFVIAKVIDTNSGKEVAAVKIAEPAAPRPAAFFNQTPAFYNTQPEPVIFERERPRPRPEIVVIERERPVVKEVIIERQRPVKEVIIERERPVKEVIIEKSRPSREVIVEKSRPSREVVEVKVGGRPGRDRDPKNCK